MLQPKLSSGLSQMDFILASQSETRCRILRNAMLPFYNVSANIDEMSVLKSLVSDGTPHKDIPNVLAEFKAKKI
jgi:predicted house-cleaning NTP pyrophosphatase (Maf/HAM1 superfamily)